MDAAAKAVIERLRAEHVGKSVKQLQVLAEEEGINVSLANIAAYLKREAPRTAVDDVEEHMHQPMPFNGKVFAEAPNRRWQADLATYEKPVRGQKGFLLLMDAFTRRIWAEPVRTNSGAEVRRAMDTIVSRQPARYDGEAGREFLKDTTLTTDGGPEFNNALFKNWTNDRGIFKRTKPWGAKNDIATLDQAMGRMKRELKLLTDSGRTDDWTKYLGQVENSWNATYNKAVHGKPAGAHTGVQAFLTMQDNAEKMEHNHQNNEKMTKNLRDAGHFRAPNPKGGMTHRTRIFDERFGDRLDVGAVESGVVTDSPGGKDWALKILLPVR